MENRAQQSGMDSVHDVSVFSNVLFVTVAAMLAAAAVCLLSGMGMSQMALRGSGRFALAVTVLGFSGVLASTLPESAGHYAADAGAVVCDGAPMFRIRCTGVVVWRQRSE